MSFWGEAQTRGSKLAPLKGKLLWTVLFLICFIVGRHIPIHLLHEKAHGGKGANAGLLSATNVATGGDFFSPSLFSLGLGPYMQAMILWRFLFIGKIARDRKIPEETVARARNVLMVALAVFQATSLLKNYEIGSAVGPFSGQLNAEIIIVVLLTAGAVLLAWIAQKNADLGLGGITMFVLYQVLLSAIQNDGVLSIAVSNPSDMHILWMVIVACVCVAVVGVLGGNAEMRLHVNKISIDSGFTGISYLAIKLNPAGASPIMYSLTLLALPQYLAHTVSSVIPSTSAGVNRFLSAWGLGAPLGFTAYLLLLFGMTIFFGLFMVGPKSVAERMQKSGEYFDHVPPGRATRQYLRNQVVLLSALSGVFLVIFTGIPLHFTASYPHLQYLLTAPATLLILLALLWRLYEELTDTMLGARYVFTFKAESGNASTPGPPRPAQ